LGFARDKNWNVHSFSLKLSNHGDKPLWFLLPASGDEPRLEKTTFRCTDAQPNLLIFQGEGRMVATGVGFCGFTAVRLPVGSALELSHFALTTRRELTTDFTETVFVEAEELLVNGKIPLETWLPFEVGVFKEKKLPSGVGKKAKMEAEKAAAAEKERPRGKVEYIEAKGVHRWTVKFQNNGEKP